MQRDAASPLASESFFETDRHHSSHRRHALFRLRLGPRWNRESRRHEQFLRIGIFQRFGKRVGRRLEQTIELQQLQLLLDGNPQSEIRSEGGGGPIGALPIERMEHGQYPHPDETGASEAGLRLPPPEPAIELRLPLNATSRSHV